MAKAKFTGLDRQPVELEITAKTKYYDGGAHREIESPADSGKYVKVSESMEDIGKAVAGAS